MVSLSATPGGTGEPAAPRGPHEPRDPREPQEPQRAGTFRTAARFIAWAVSLDPRRMGVLLGLSLLGSFVPAATVYMVQGVLHAAQRLYAGETAVGSLYAWLGLWAGLTFFTSGVLPPLRTLFSERLRQELTASTHRQLFAKTQRLRLEVFERPDFHDLVQRAQEAAGPGRFTFLLWEVIGMLQAPLTIASVAAIVGVQSPMVLVALLMVSLPAPIAQVVQGLQAFRLQRAQTDDERLRGYLARVLTTPAAAKEVRTYGLARLLLDGWSRLQAQVAERIFRQQSRHQGLRAALNALGVVGLAGGVLWSAWALALGKLSPPQFAGMLVAMQAVRSGVGTLVGRYDWVSRNMLKVADLFVFLELGPEEPQGGQMPGDPAALPLALEHVAFRYPQAAADALMDVTLTLRPGERIAVVGENGSGKTTLVKLLIGLYRPTAGRVTLGGRDLLVLDPGGLRDQVAAVFQDFTHYAFTLRENIGFGRIEQVADEPAVRQAAAKGGADVVAETLPEGYETPLTREFDEGTELSGGQWQRIAIARGFMRDAAVVILDEPTAALDPQAEADVYRRFAQMAGRKTAVLVSHRLGSARLCDRIAVLKAGRLVEVGTHDALLAQGGEYARLWSLQAQWYAEGERRPG